MSWCCRLCGRGRGLGDAHLPRLSSLRLRAPKSPDATADITQHRFTYAVLPHQGECPSEPRGERRLSRLRVHGG